jgi:hypothetical protein
MMRHLFAAVLIAALASPAVAGAQESPPGAQPVAGTSAAPVSPAPGNANRSGAQASEAHKAEQDALEPAVDTSAAQQTAAAQQTPAAPQPESEAPAQAKSGKAMDHLQLGTTDITGNRELPKVLYIVPWKHSDLGDLAGKPLNSLVDEALQPIDRDVFKRENRYYRAVAQKGTAAGGSRAGSGANASRSGAHARNPASGDER